VVVRWIFAVLLFLVGAVWILQGVDVLGGSFMSGNGIWAVFGTILIIIGVVLLRTPRSRSDVESPPD
jgi:hypothetical protein